MRLASGVAEGEPFSAADELPVAAAVAVCADMRLAADEAECTAPAAGIWVDGSACEERGAEHERPGGPMAGGGGSAEGGDECSASLSSSREVESVRDVWMGAGCASLDASGTSDARTYARSAGLGAVRHQPSPSSP